MLQTQDLRVDQEKGPCIQINIRELDGVFNTILGYWFMLQYY